VLAVRMRDRVREFDKTWQEAALAPDAFIDRDISRSSDLFAHCQVGASQSELVVR
jgi:hypothetical protein